MKIRSYMQRGLRDGAERLYFRAVGEPLGVRVHSLRPTKKKDRPKTVLVEVAGLEPTVSSTRNWRDTNFATPRYNFFVFYTLGNLSSPELALIPVRSHSRLSALNQLASLGFLLCGLHFQKTTLSCFFSFTNFATPRYNFFVFIQLQL